jgi:hypothetical protein
MMSLIFNPGSLDTLSPTIDPNFWVTRKFFHLPYVEGQVPVFISPRKKVVRLYPQAVGSLFFASYD